MLGEIPLWYSYNIMLPLVLCSVTLYMDEREIDFLKIIYTEAFNDRKYLDTDRKYI